MKMGKSKKVSLKNAKGTLKVNKNKSITNAESLAKQIKVILGLTS
jgi:hypothetical protein